MALDAQFNIFVHVKKKKKKKKKTRSELAIKEINSMGIEGLSAKAPTQKKRLTADQERRRRKAREQLKGLRSGGR